ncbi:putative component of type VI protein secretion system [Pseudomonas sp. TE24901]
MGDERVTLPVPSLDRLMGLRDALVALKGPLADDPELRENLQKHLFNEETDRRVLGKVNIPTLHSVRLIPFGTAL